VFVISGGVSESGGRPPLHIWKSGAEPADLLVLVVKCPERVKVFVTLL